MKKILSDICKFILWFWQLPQVLVGLCFLTSYLRHGRIVKMQPYKGSFIFKIRDFKGGVCFGPIIFVNAWNWELIKHEFGHARQSRYFGPLYLLIIGLPSLIWASVYKAHWKKSYYWFWTERWADHLGKVSVIR